MEFFGGSQVSSYVVATSFVWSSSVVLLIVGLMYFLNYKDRKKSINNTSFLTIYFFALVLNTLEYVLNAIMQYGSSYEVLFYRFYTLIGFVLDISLIFYFVYFYTSSDNTKSGNRTIRIIQALLCIIACVVCLTLDIDAVLETNGKFYVLSGTLSTIYNIFTLMTDFFVLSLVIIFRKNTTRNFFLLCILSTVLYATIFFFEMYTGYTIKGAVFVIVLIVFNATVNQDKEYINEFYISNSYLSNINIRRSKLLNKVNYQLEDSLNDLILYNDELFLAKDTTRNLIQSDSALISQDISNLYNYMDIVSDISMIESNNSLENVQYKLNYLISRVNAQIQPLASLKKINLNFDVDKNTYLNYVGDYRKIEKIIINTLNSIVNNTTEGKTILVSVSNIKKDYRNIELDFVIKNDDIRNSINIGALNLKNFIDSKNKYSRDEMNMVVTNSLLELFNSKINVKKEDNNIVYSFSIVQGFKGNELYNSIN